MAQLHNTREAWLAAAVEALRPNYAGAGKPLPDRIRVSCGWPSRGGTSPTKVVMGETWDSTQSDDKAVEIFISPRSPDAVIALDTLAHELVHAALFAADKKHGHGKSFQKLAAAIGLEEPWTGATAGPALKARLVDLAAELGDYPASPLRPKHKEKKQTVRMRKCTCEKCGYTLRTTQKWIAVAVPQCPVDKVEMFVEAPDDGQESTGEGQEGGAAVEGLAQG